MVTGQLMVRQLADCELVD